MAKWIRHQLSQLGIGGFESHLGCGFLMWEQHMVWYLMIVSDKDSNTKASYLHVHSSLLLSFNFRICANMLVAYFHTLYGFLR